MTYIEIKGPNKKKYLWNENYLELVERSIYKLDSVYIMLKKLTRVFEENVETCGNLDPIENNEHDLTDETLDINENIRSRNFTKINDWLFMYIILNFFFNFYVYNSEIYFFDKDIKETMISQEIDSWVVIRKDEIEFIKYDQMWSFMIDLKIKVYRSYGFGNENISLIYLR